MTSTGHIDLDWSHIWPVTHFREKEFWCVQQSCSPYRKMAKEMEFNMSAAVVLNLVPLSFWSHHNCQAGDQLPHIKFHANQTTDCRVATFSFFPNFQYGVHPHCDWSDISKFSHFQDSIFYMHTKLDEKKPFFGRDMVKMISNMAAAAFLNLLPVFGRLTSASAQSNFIQIRQ